MRKITLTSVEVRLLELLLSLDPGPLGLTSSQAASALRLLGKLRQEESARD